MSVLHRLQIFIYVVWMLLAVSATQAALPRFSTLPAGNSIGAPLRHISLPSIAPNQYALIDDAGATVLRMTSMASASSIALPIQEQSAQTASNDSTANSAAPTTLTWRWKVSNVLTNANLRNKSGDDFAARVYVFFDVPLASLPLAERSRIRLARLFSGADVPTAALCYVWDNKYPIGETAWNAYTDRVRMVVLRSGADDVGQWVRETRDVAADFRQAFGFAAPRVTGIAVSSDTDQTRESVTSWFGDFTLVATKAEVRTP
jgi:Protein of unknown function (DUF3047)